MSEKDDGAAFLCKWCTEPAFRKQGRIWLCQKHYRFQTMRSSAKRLGKTVPTYDVMETLLPSDMVCIGCDREMVWTQAQDRSRVISLQHDRSGVLRFLCRSCNTRHGQMEGDSFYDLEPGHKQCPGCKRALPYEKFNKRRDGWAGLDSYCKECNRERCREWEARNREYANRKQRERRAAATS